MQFNWFFVYLWYSSKHLNKLWKTSKITVLKATLWLNSANCIHPHYPFRRPRSSCFAGWKDTPIWYPVCRQTVGKKDSDGLVPNRFRYYSIAWGLRNFPNSKKHVVSEPFHRERPVCWLQRLEPYLKNHPTVVACSRLYLWHFKDISFIVDNYIFRNSKIYERLATLLSFF